MVYMDYRGGITGRIHGLCPPFLAGGGPRGVQDSMCGMNCYINNKSS